MNFNNLVSLEITSDNIALIRLNANQLPTNLLTYAFLSAYQQAIEAAFANENVLGAIVISDKKDFIAGGDLKAFSNLQQSKAEIFAEIMDMHKIMRTIELKQKPIVAAINGNALGGGFEFALACNYRIALDNDAIKIGLPEVNLGLIPGGGGTQRLMRTIGLQDAIANILQCRLLNPKAALKAGFIHEIAADTTALLAAAQNWILNNPIAMQPWDKKGFTLPKGKLDSVMNYGQMAGAIGNLRKQTHGNYPGAQAALAALYEGSIINNIDRALEVEARYFVQALFSKEAQNLIKTGFFAMNEAKKGKHRPQSIDKNTFTKIGILGAGVMGAGLAYAAIKNKIQVILVDKTLEIAQNGKAQVENLLMQEVEKGKILAAQAQTLLGQITISDKIEDFATIDFLIESLPEDLSLKQNMLALAMQAMGEGKIIASNTSTLPIAALGEKTNMPSQIIGMHFFAQVEKMPLVEIVKNENTSPKALATAIDFALLLGKTPIVINDKFGFFATRILGAYTGEAALMIKEGIKPILIENAAKNAGFATTPLALIDDLSLAITLGILKLTPVAQKPAHVQDIMDVYTTIIQNIGMGKKAGKGFYNYENPSEKMIHPTLAQLFAIAEHQPSQEVVATRLFTIMALEAYKALEENVILDIQDGNIASLLGMGFPAYTGGVLSYINYIGIKQFVDNARQLQMAYGDRFAIPTSLLALAESNQELTV